MLSFLFCSLGREDATRFIEEKTGQKVQRLRTIDVSEEYSASETQFVSIHSSEDGGAVEFRGKSLRLSTVMFFDCSSGTKGGAIHCAQNERVSMSTVLGIRCQAGIAGGFFIESDEASLDDVNQTVNKAERISSIKLTSHSSIKNSFFFSCITSLLGVLLDLNGDFSIAHCVFRNQTVEKEAAGIKITGLREDGVIQGCSFEQLRGENREFAIFKESKGHLQISESFFDTDRTSIRGDDITIDQLTSFKEGKAPKWAFFFATGFVPLAVLYALIHMCLPLIRAKRRAHLR